MEETKPVPAAATGAKRTAGRKFFDGLAILTLAVFALFVLAITVGAALIPRLREWLASSAGAAGL